MTCFAERSGPVSGVPSAVSFGWPCSSSWGTPALRKYLETMMSVATWDQEAGTSASFISKTTEPSGLVIREVRWVHSMPLKPSAPGWVKTREMESPFGFVDVDREVRVPSLPAIVVSFLSVGGDRRMVPVVIALHHVGRARSDVDARSRIPGRMAGARVARVPVRCRATSRLAGAPGSRCVSASH